MYATCTLLTALLLAPLAALHAAEPPAVVPQSVTELWADFDPRKDPLETEVIREWKSDGMVLRHVRFLVSTFKGTEVMDLGTGEEWPRLLSKVRRPWGNWFVALLWNPGTQEQTVTLDFAKAGLDPAHRYAVWSFWDDQFLGIAKGQWVTPSLPAGGCQHLVLTDLDGQPGKPVVIGSNLHIFCGAAEIKNINATPTGIDIELTDAGAREGDLFLYSPKPLAAKTATGCTVKSVEAAGENVWKIHLEGRASSKPQKVGVSVANQSDK